MSFGIKVAGSAPMKRPLKEKPQAWTHPCVEGVTRELPGYMSRCPDCKTRRPT